MELWAVIAVVVLLVYLIIPWVNLGRAQAARRQIRALQLQVANLENALADAKGTTPSEQTEAVAADTTPQAVASPTEADLKAAETFTLEPAADIAPEPPAPEPPAPSPPTSLSPASEASIRAHPRDEPAAKAKPPAATATASPPKSFQSSDPTADHARFERHFGAKLPVWIGGIALALAGVFLVKYSIEQGLLSPTVRVVLGMAFGCALLYGGNWVRLRPRFSDGTRIAQALSGAGIAVLYGCLFAGANLYALFSPAVGFAGMAVVTAGAVLLSLWHGVPIALLGMVGGFLTPALVGSTDPSAPVLFLYLYFVLTGLLLVIRRQGWWWMSIPAVVGAFLWVCIWLLGGNFTPDDSLWLGLFLIAVCATVVGISKKQLQRAPDAAMPSWRTELLAVSSILNLLTMSGSVVLLAFVVEKAGFGLMEWGLFGCLALGGVGLAYWNQRVYGHVPWLSMVVNAFMLAAWDTSDHTLLALTIAAFAALYIACGVRLQSRSEQPLPWAGLVTATSLGYYLMAYYLLEGSLLRSMDFFWGGMAVGLCALGVWMIWHLYTTIPAGHPQKQHHFTCYAATATAFLSLALTIELPREFLSVAFALQLLALCWINTLVHIRALRWIVALMGGVFGFLLLPQIFLLLQLAAYGLVEAKLHLQEGVPIVDFPLFQLGLPALCFVGGSILLRRLREGQQETATIKDDALVHSLEVAAIALVGVMGYYLTRKGFHADENVLFIQAGFFERGVITNVLYLYGLACLWLGRRYERAAVAWSGLGLCGIALFRIVYFDLIAYNPLWAEQQVGTWPLLNAMLLPYGLPILWTWLATRPRFTGALPGWRGLGQGTMLLLGFALITLSVRQWFHGDYLHDGITSTTEVYAYSVAWLLGGIGLLLAGTLQASRMLRMASLIVMLLTVGKVFLYDAAELDGLLRVASFLGLGVSLIGLSWFYTRYVFGAGKQA